MEKKENHDGRDLVMIRFPWRRDNAIPGSRASDDSTKPGEYILQTLFLEFCAVAERKVEQVLAEPLVNEN